MSYSRPGSRIRARAKRRRAADDRGRRIASGRGAWRGPDPDLLADGNYPDFAPPEYDGPDDGFGRPDYGEVV